jgi:hypothetical protein
MYLSTLGGVSYLVLDCGIKVTWWDKLRSRCFPFDVHDIIWSSRSFDIQLFKFIIADMLIFIRQGYQTFYIIHPSCISAHRNRYSNNLFLTLSFIVIKHIWSLFEFWTDFDTFLCSAEPRTWLIRTLLFTIQQ